MYNKFKEKVEAFLSKDIDKKSKYETILKDLEKRIDKLKDKKEQDKGTLQELKSLEKLKKKTKLMIESLK